MSESAENTTPPESDLSPETSEPSKSDDPSKAKRPAKSKKAKKPKKKGRWRRRFIALLVIAVVLRLLLHFTLPTIVSVAFESFGLECEYDDIDLSILGGDVEIHDLVIRTEGSEEEAIHLEYARVDVAMLALLTGNIVLRRVEVDGLDVVVERESDGTIPLLAGFLGEASDEAPEPEEPAEVEEIDPEAVVDLSLPVEIDFLRVQHVYATLRDASVTPAVETRVDVHLRISELGGETPGRIELLVSSPNLIDSFRLESEAAALGRDANASFSFQGRGVRPAALEGYLAALGIESTGEPLDFQGLASFSATPTQGDPRGADTKLEISDLQLSSADANDASTSSVTVDASLWPDKLHVRSVKVSGVRGNAQRAADGSVIVAGLKLPATAAGSAPASTPAESPDTQESDATDVNETPATGPAPASQFTALLDLLEVSDVELAFQDHAVSPSNRLAFRTEEFQLSGIAFPFGTAAAPANIAATLSLPGITEKITVGGDLQLGTDSHRVDLRANCDQLTAAALKPYLDPLGITPLFQEASGEGSFSATVGLAENETRVDLQLADLSLRDGDEKFFSLADVTIGSVRLDSDSGEIHVAKVSVSGGELPIQRPTSETVQVLGFSFTAPKSASDASPTQDATASTATEFAGFTTPVLPRVRIDSIVVENQILRWTDNSVEPAVHTGIEAKKFELLAVDTSETAPAARLNVNLSLPGLIEDLTATGSLAAQIAKPSLGVKVNATGVHFKALAPYLSALGIESQLESGSLSTGLQANATLGKEIQATVSIDETSFTDGDETWLATKGVSVEGIRLRSPTDIEVGRIVVSEPRARVRRDATGALHVMGLAIAQAPTAKPKSAVEPESGSSEDSKAALRALADRGKTDTVTSDTVTSDAVTSDTNPAASPFGFRIGQVQVASAGFTWIDEFVEDKIEIQPLVDLSLDGVDLAETAAPAKLSTTLRIPNHIEELSFVADLRTSATKPEIKGQVDAKGIRLAELTQYLPPGTESEIDNGRLSAKIEARSAPVADGGIAANLAFNDISWAQAEKTWLAVESVVCSVSRVDPAGGQVIVDEISVSGVQTEARRVENDGLSLLGLVVRAPPPREQESREETAADEAESATSTPDAAAAKAAVPSVLPLVEVKKFRLELASFDFLDTTSDESKPLAVRELVLELSEAMKLLGENPGDLPPLLWKVSGHADPIAKELSVQLELSPFVAEPTIKIDVGVQGIRGAGLTEVLPELAELLDGHRLDGGTLTTKLEARLRARRRGPLDFALQDAFGAELTIEDVKLSNGDGQVLIGLDELRADVARVDPESGDVHVRSLEIVKPQGIVKRAKEHIEILGIAIALPPADSKPNPEGEVKPASAKDGNAELKPAVARIARPKKTREEIGAAAEIRVDELLISGIDFEIADISTETTARVPIVDLDVEVKKFTTRALSEPLPIRFSAFVRGGEIELPERLTKSFLHGALSDTVNVLAGDHTGPKTEKRRAFEEVSATGQFALFPEPTGWAKVSVSALELGNFKGPASDFGVVLEDGVFDAAIDLRIKPNGMLDTKARFTNAHLSLSEGGDGPITRYLKLPMPLDAVLFVLRDEDGQISIPLDFETDPKVLDWGTYSAVAASTLVSLVSDAIAASPFRIVGGVTDLAGLRAQANENKRDPGQAAVELDFEPATMLLSPATLKQLEPVVAELLGLDEEEGKRGVLTLEHRFGSRDLSRARNMANPPRRDCVQLIATLEHQRDEISVRRERRLADARVAYSARADKEAKKFSEELRRLHEELGRIEVALDRLYDLLQPGAERNADRRARGLAMEIGQGRLQAITRYLESQGIPDAAERIRLRPVRIGDIEAEHGRVAAFLSSEQRTD